MTAAALVRRWLAARPEPDAVAIERDIAAIGRIAVERSVREIARGGGGGGVAGGDSASLRAIETIVAALDPPPVPSRDWLGRLAPSVPPPPDLAALAAMIEAERDAALRAVLRLETDRLRFMAITVALGEAAVLLETLERVAVAAAREIERDRPGLALLLRDAAQVRAQQRRRDVTMQRVVLGQAITANDLVAAGHRTLIETLERASTLTVGAVRTAISVRGVNPIVASFSAERDDPLSRAVARLDATIARRGAG